MINAWLKLVQYTSEADYNLVCLPFAGGYAEFYLPWRHHLPKQIQLCPIQLPGRSYRWQEPMYNDIKSLLDEMIPNLNALLDERPYILFGHSMGAYIAYELSNMLVQKNMPLPSLLVVSSAPSPYYWRSRKLLSQLNENEFYNFFLELGGFSPELLKHETFIKMQMSLLRNDITLCESCKYIKAAQFSFPILSLGGSNDNYVMMKSMAAWQQETNADFSLHELTGNHFYLNENLSRVLELIQQRMSINVNV